MRTRAQRVVGKRFRFFSSKPLPEPEPVYAPKPRPMTGLFALLSAEQKAYLLSYSGPENHGDAACLVSNRRTHSDS